MILAIDPGTTSGWARLEDDDSVTSGLVILPQQAHGDRLWAFWQWLEAQSETCELVAYEQPSNHFAGANAARLLHGIEAIVLAWASRHALHVKRVTPQTLKKHATGHGRATKHDMCKAARARWPELEIKSDHEADALWVLDWATK